MSNRETNYWRFFNVIGRFVGIWFLILGGGLFAWTLTQGDWLVICFTALAPIFGILLLCAKPFRPDLEDSESSKSQNSHKD